MPGLQNLLFGSMDDYIWGTQNFSAEQILGDSRRAALYRRLQKKNPAVFDVFACHVRPNFYWTAEDYPVPSGERNWTIFFGFGCAVPVDRSKAHYEITDEYVNSQFLFAETVATVILLLGGEFF